MLLVIPVSRSDKHLIPNAQKAFSLFPPGDGHELLVVGTPNVSAEVDGLFDSLSLRFLTSRSHIFDSDSFLGWPGSPNYYFQQTAFLLNGQGPWLWFELDCTPFRENWLSIIAEAYRSGSTRFMGCLERTYRGFNGDLLSEEDGGKHMAACGVYPADLVDTVVPLKGIHATDIPWWSFLQWYIAPFTGHTNLIQNNYKTENYQVEKTITNFKGERCYLSGEKRVGFFSREVICDSCNNTAWDNHYNSRINPDAVLVHGCKDGSLLEVLTKPPKSFGEGIKDIEEGRVVDLDTALTKPYKPKPRSYRRKRKKVLELPV